MKENKIIEHKFFVLDTLKRNKNYRMYPGEVIKPWLDDERLKRDEGIDVEYALNEEAEIENDYLLEHLSCGIVPKLEFKETKLFATVKFKKNKLTEDIYSGKIKLEDLALIPKGKGSVRNQTVQEDYELFGFNLVKRDESSFIEDPEEKKEKAEQDAE